MSLYRFLVVIFPNILSPSITLYFVHRAPEEGKGELLIWFLVTIPSYTLLQVKKSRPRSFREALHLFRLAEWTPGFASSPAFAVLSGKGGMCAFALTWCVTSRPCHYFSLFPLLTLPVRSFARYPHSFPLHLPHSGRLLSPGHSPCFFVFPIIFLLSTLLFPSSGERKREREKKE